MQASAFNENMWFAFAEPSRRKLIDLLLLRGESTASKLAGEVPFSRQAVAKHMAVLRKAGLIRERRVGKEHRFAIEPAGLAAAAKELSEASELWDVRLQNIKQIAEAIHTDGGSTSNPPALT